MPVFKIIKTKTWRRMTSHNSKRTLIWVTMRNVLINCQISASCIHSKLPRWFHSLIRFQSMRVISIKSLKWNKPIIIQREKKRLLTSTKAWALFLQRRVTLQVQSEWKIRLALLSAWVRRKQLQFLFGLNFSISMRSKTNKHRSESSKVMGRHLISYLLT